MAARGVGVVTPNTALPLAHSEEAAACELVVRIYECPKGQDMFLSSFRSPTFER
eukprot:m.474436 g.474436  ORF g.474436 m.474436 type:complete len:54 (-) comp36256_c0_seq1:24-185(-)